MPNRGESLENLARKVLWEFAQTFARTFGHALAVLAVSIIAGELTGWGIKLPAWPPGRQ